MEKKRNEMRRKEQTGTEATWNGAVTTENG